jgi:peptidoglycan/xylan/chitin deacetylase (PgdA/CDA1 family)
MLQLLKEHQIHATFFIIGECIARFPQLWKQAIEDGHQICNHSDTHNRYFNTKDTLLLEQEIL